MLIVPRKKALPVEKLSQIKELIKETHEVLTTYKHPKGLPKVYVALHHAQICADPYNFFIINPAVIGAKKEDIIAIINPKILTRYKETKGYGREGCMSFPFRSDVKVGRYDKIRVSYQKPNKLGLKLIDVEEDVEGFLAHVFQHEIEHTNGTHVYTGLNKNSH